jgi:CubicO group peptidase (beta-lactamase class C family)
MARSSITAKDLSPDDNVVTSYAILEDGSHLPFDVPVLEDGGLQGAAGYVRSTVRDMLIWAKAVMDAEASEIGLCGTNATENHTVLYDIALCRSAFRPIVHEDSPLENTYGLGWFRHMLLSKWLGTIGPNFGWLLYIGGIQWGFDCLLHLSRDAECRGGHGQLFGWAR